MGRPTRYVDLNRCYLRVLLFFSTASIERHTSDGRHFAASRGPPTNVNARRPSPAGLPWAHHRQVHNGRCFRSTGAGRESGQHAYSAPPASVEAPAWAVRHIRQTQCRRQQRFAHHFEQPLSDRMCGTRRPMVFSRAPNASVLFVACSTKVKARCVALQDPVDPVFHLRKGPVH